MDAILYVADNGIKWRALPVGFPSCSTVYNYFAAWEAAETVSRDSREVEEGKKINGRRRHIATDTLGLLVCVLVTTANTPDRIARQLLARLQQRSASLRHLWADSGYAGTLLDWVRNLFGITIDIVAKLADQITFVALPGAGSSNEP